MRDDVERTEPPTPHKIEEARQRGIVPKSREIVGLFVLLSIILFLWFAGKSVVESFQQGIGVITAREFSGGVMSYIFGIIGKIVFPILLIAAVFAILGNVVQVGFFIATKAFEPKAEKFNPFENFTRLFSLRNLVELSKAAAKSFVILGIVFIFLYLSREKVDQFFGVNIADILPKSAGIVMQISLIIIGFLLFLSVVDYAWQRWDWWKSLMMSRSELREEMRRYEGDPQIRSRVRRRMYEMARTRMMAEVPRADVVITNPTHLAIALKYEREKMKAPKVVAKGMNYIAQKIVEIAKQNNVPIYQDPPLAWALHKSTEVGDFIPETLYKAVAKVLAYVIMLKQKNNKT
ncbi:MAG: flagellar biosynthesis protein FlhB [Candidatus Calescibacterium sp.]|nr:flagellar biosynthesis protein FlhB [Candidatus Calescibacterium sp.]MCX7734750.1 flagellar biosynthesis protein FlhB [bacterium]MDW8087268.1 flagellar biosynthesis protein FlhB [Candidatus Calescibacterium sp.]